MSVFDKKLNGGVVEMVQNPMKKEELVCESKPNVNEEMKAEPGVEKTNEDLVKDEKIEAVSIMFFFFFFLSFSYSNNVFSSSLCNSQFIVSHGCLSYSILQLHS